MSLLRKQESVLAELTIKDFALIDELALSFEPGLNIITGETGAGKSIIIESINLLVGGRADISRVKHGADMANIGGLFVLHDGEEFALKRVVGGDGRNRAFINGEPATAGQLSELGDKLLDIHGQHEHQALLKPQSHLALIDRFGAADISAAKDVYQRVLADYRAKKRALAELSASDAERRQRHELLAWHVKELGAAELKVGEDEELQTKITRLKSGAKFAEAVNRARAALGAGGLDNVYQACQEVTRIADIDSSLNGAVELLKSAAADLDEADRLLSAYGEGLEFDERLLDAYQDRLFFLADLKKKYGLSLDGLIDYLERALTDIQEMDNPGNRPTRLSEEVDLALAGLKEAAANLSILRAAAAGDFARSVREQLLELAMGAAEFSSPLITKVSSADDYGDNGFEEAEFFFSANAGEPPRPLARIASGGELSRVMLAVRSVFGRADSTPTLVFDEIDAGIGGKTAVRVGERLAELSRSHQVICVTHLAQIAAFADRHLAVTKSAKDGGTFLDVRPVDGADRLAELSRLGGSLNESRVSVEHARQLLDQAREKKAEAVANG